MKRKPKVLVLFTKKQKSIRSIVDGKLVRPAIAELIRDDFPDWNEDAPICKTDLKSV